MNGRILLGCGLLVLAVLLFMFVFQDAEKVAPPLSDEGRREELQERGGKPETPESSFSASVMGHTNTGEGFQLCRVSLRFEDETRESVIAYRVWLQGRDSGDLASPFRAVDATTWVGRVKKGPWNLFVRTQGSSELHRFSLEVRDDLRQDNVVPVNVKHVELLLLDRNEEPVTESCEIKWTPWPADSRARQLSGMSRWSQGWPIGVQPNEKQAKVKRALGPKISLRMQAGARYHLLISADSGLYLSKRIDTPAGSKGNPLVLILAPSDEKTFQVKDADVIDGNYKVELVSGFDWSHSQWQGRIDGRGFLRIKGFQPFLGGNLALLKSLGDSSQALPLGIEDMPAELWQFPGVIPLHFSVVGSEPWQWEGASEEGSRLEFRLLVSGSKKTQKNVETYLGSVLWSRELELPKWLRNRECQCLLLRANGTEVEVDLDVEARVAKLSFLGVIKIRLLDSNERPIAGARVSFRPKMVAPRPGKVRLQTMASSADGRSDLSLPKKSDGAVLEIRHPDFQYQEMDVPQDLTQE